MPRYNYDCVWQCGDEECDKCFYHGIIFECPADCKEYKSQYDPSALREIKKEVEAKNAEA